MNLYFVGLLSVPSFCETSRMLTSGLVTSPSSLQIDRGSTFCPGSHDQTQAASAYLTVELPFASLAGPDVVNSPGEGQANAFSTQPEISIEMDFVLEFPLISDA